jgi:hypothetical protein
MEFMFILKGLRALKSLNQIWSDLDLSVEIGSGSCWSK